MYARACSFMLIIVWMFAHRHILKVLSMYHKDAKMIMVGLRALALLLKSGNACVPIIHLTK